MKVEIDPVVLLVFNRPDTTACVLEGINEMRPTTLIVVVDGPRPGFPKDQELCKQVRAVIETLSTGMLTYHCDNRI